MTYSFSELDKRQADIQEWLKKEFSTIRTGQATPAILDNVKVDSYGSPLPVSQVANVGVEDARSLRIAPWDTSQIPNIEKAIQDADLGLSINVDDKGLRVIFPELTGERREQLKKLAGQKREEAVVSLRSAREETWEEIQKMKKDSEITEDDMYRYKEQMEEKTQNAQKALKDMEEKKIKEIEA